MENLRYPNLNKKLPLSNRAETKKWSINDFEIGRPLGKGNFGKVYLAREKKSKYIVCLKLIKIKKFVKEKMIVQLRREVENSLNILHPNIIRTFGFFFDTKYLYLIQEYAPGGNVYKLIEKNRKLDEETAAKYFCQICDAIQYCHIKNIIHRDIKPENIVIDINNNVKITDFGMSVHSPTQCRTTQCGTPHYTSPEIFDHSEYDSTTDNWSLGILLYEFLVGVPPFDGNSCAEIRKKVQDGFIDFTYIPSLDARDLIKQLLNYQPNERIKLTDVRRHKWIVRQLGNPD